RKGQLLGREIWIGRRNSRAAQYHVDRIYAALAIVVEKEKGLVFDNGTADVTTELVNVKGWDRAAQLSNTRAPGRDHQAWRPCRWIRRKSTGSVVKEGVRVQRPVPVELECSAVELVAARLRDHVDDCASGPAEFSRVPIGVHLKLLNRVLRKLVWSS